LCFDRVRGPNQSDQDFFAGSGSDLTLGTVIFLICVILGRKNNFPVYRTNIVYFVITFKHDYFLNYFSKHE
jgi:hypothetical protein